MNQRDIRLDLLRVVGAFFVVWLHVSAGVVTSTPSWSSINWWMGNLGDAYSRWAVPIFVMVSGALLLAQSSEIDPLHFYQKRAARLFIPIIFWSVFYILWIFLKSGQFNVRDSVRNILDGKPYFHLWYLYMIVGLSIFAPFIKQFVKDSPRKLIAIMICVAFFIASVHDMVGSLRGNIFSATFLGSWAPFVGYFTAGYYLVTYPCVRFSKRKLLLTAGCCGALIALITGVLLPLLGAKSWNLMYSNLNPLVIIMSLTIFIALVGIDKNSFENQQALASIVSYVAPLTLGVYVIHPIWLEILGDFGISGMSFSPAIAIPGVTFLVFSLSLISALGLYKIPILQLVIK